MFFVLQFVVGNDKYVCDELKWTDNTFRCFFLALVQLLVEGVKGSCSLLSPLSVLGNRAMGQAGSDSWAANINTGPQRVIRDNVALPGPLLDKNRWSQGHPSLLFPSPPLLSIPYGPLPPVLSPHSPAPPPTFPQHTRERLFGQLVVISS